MRNVVMAVLAVLVLAGAMLGLARWLTPPPPQEAAQDDTVSIGSRAICFSSFRGSHSSSLLVAMRVHATPLHLTNSTSHHRLQQLASWPLARWLRLPPVWISHPSPIHERPS